MRSMELGEHERRLRLYDAGKTDKEIAEAVGVKCAAIWNWRRRTGLPCVACKSFVSAATKRKMNQLYMEGFNDREIGEAVGISTRRIQRWREREDLPANMGGAKYAKRLQMFMAGEPLEDISKDQGVKVESLRLWFKRNGLSREEDA